MEQPGQVKEFLEALYGEHLKKHKGFIEVLALSVSKKPFYFDSIPGLLETFNTFTGNVFFGVAPRDKERANKEAITYITCIWTDIDTGTEGHEAPGYFKTQVDALKVINEFKPKPSIIVSSGRGLHLYWLLKESNNDLDGAEEILNGIGKVLQGDRGTWERTRLLRLPGTLNCKVQNSPKECKIIDANYSLIYDLKDFEDYKVIGLKDFESKEVVFNKDAPIFSIEDLFTNKIAPGILNLIKDRDTKGKYLKQDGTIDRSERDQAVILELLKTGHKPDTIRGIFINKDYPVSDKYFEMGKRGDYYLARSIENAQRFLDSGIIQEKREKKLIVPKEADSILMTVLLPELPLIIEQDGQQLLSFTYESPLTNTFVRGDTNKEMLKDLELTGEDITKYRAIQWEGSIANYLMDKKANTGADKIDGSVDEIARFFIKKPRQEDYKRVEVNLKSLAIRQYLIKKDRREIVFMVFHPFIFDEKTKTFSAGLSTLVPKVVGEVMGGNNLYISKNQIELYPKQDKYLWAIRNYFASIKHSQTIKQISGIKLLENSGYLADVLLNRKKYRNSEAQKIIDKFTKVGLKQHGFVVGCHKQDLMIKDIRKKMFYIRISDKRRDLIRHDNEFLDILGKFILRQPGNNNLAISINRAQGLFNKYGVIAVKGIYYKNYKKEGFSLTVLERILSQGVQEAGS